MDLELRGRGVGTLVDLRLHLERRLRFALGKFAGCTTRTLVRVEDVNGPRGGVDKRCRIQIGLIPSGDVVVEATGPQLYEAIDRAAERAGRVLQRRLERRHQLLRRPPRRPLSLRGDAEPELLVPADVF